MLDFLEQNLQPGDFTSGSGAKQLRVPRGFLFVRIKKGQVETGLCAVRIELYKDKALHIRYA